MSHKDPKPTSNPPLPKLLKYEYVDLKLKSEIYLVMISADWGLVWIDSERNGTKTAYLRNPPADGVGVEFKKIMKEGSEITVEVQEWKTRRSMAF